MKNQVLRALAHLRKDKRAVTVIEYTLLAALVGLALATALTGLEGKISTALTSIGNGL